MTDYESMSDFEINKATAKALGLIPHIDRYSSSAVLIDRVKSVDYCNNPVDAWPIIAGNKISIMYDWESSVSPTARGVKTTKRTGGKFFDPIEITIPNPLRAAMIVFLMMQESEQ